MTRQDVLALIKTDNPDIIKSIIDKHVEDDFPVRHMIAALAYRTNNLKVIKMLYSAGYHFSSWDVMHCKPNGNEEMITFVRDIIKRREYENTGS